MRPARVTEKKKKKNEDIAVISSHCNKVKNNRVVFLVVVFFCFCFFSTGWGKLIFIYRLNLIVDFLFKFGALFFSTFEIRDIIR